MSKSHCFKSSRRRVWIWCCIVFGLWGATYVAFRSTSIRIAFDPMAASRAQLPAEFAFADPEVFRHVRFRFFRDANVAPGDPHSVVNVDIISWKGAGWAVPVANALYWPLRKLDGAISDSTVRFSIGG